MMQDAVPYDPLCNGCCRAAVAETEARKRIEALDKRLAEITEAIGYDPAWMAIAGDCNPVVHAIGDLIANYQWLTTENGVQAVELAEARKRIETFEEDTAELGRCINQWAERCDALRSALGSTLGIVEGRWAAWPATDEYTATWRKERLAEWVAALKPTDVVSEPPRTPDVAP